jgi:peroxiredoxin Q/BCP
MAAKRAGGGKASKKITARGGKPAPKKAAAAPPAKAEPAKARPKSVKKKASAKPAAAAKPVPAKQSPAKKIKTAPKAEPKAASKKAAAKAAPVDNPAEKPVKKKAAAKVAPAEKPVKKKAVAKAEGQSNGLKAGDPAPSIEVVDHDGNAFALDSLHGESYLLYFYPKDDTPGCTREACTFRDDLGKFEGAKVRVIGISPDKPESHVKFRDKYGLPFTLLSDVDKTAANAFGVLVKKQNYGREYMGIERSTFLVDDSGTIKKVWRNVRVDGHSAAILEAASS